MDDRDEELTRLRAELASTMHRYAPTYGVFETGIAPLHFIRSDAPTDVIHTVHKPGLCIVVQGRKQVQLWEESYVYDPLNYLVVSVTLPLAGQVTEASSEKPYFCIRLDIDPAEIAQLIADVSPIGVPSQQPHRGLYLDKIDSSLLDAMLRLVRLLDVPSDIPALAPLALREIFYRLLKGQQGQRLHEIAITDSQTHRVTRAIEWLNNNYAEPLHIDELASYVNLSNSTLHHRFKAVTAMSPLQYQKQLRLQHARRLMISEGLDVSTAGFKVGYESPSQFSREYSRMFGAPPSRDIAKLRSFG
ncbi:Regulatory protein PchR [compost metagenome]|uniref:AraC family transcriptional regulator n=1 Tax=Pseudomonas TaxID=286 RepID=UPI000DC5E092|nr:MULTISPECIES: AraC family transcriptional regulator [Pseudomonas]MBT9238669.1 AraC family transcriptional regulator [Pseudomonas sp. MG-2]MCM8914928.1 AraC family transcriptional regulator [Pseudomonas inefficax]RAM67708.1 AraC family transcriptional regulator [Pseudomonas putida]WNN39027.1 AraC family transcriptional regulator [Pseudomonas inefficax]